MKNLEKYLSSRKKINPRLGMRPLNNREEIGFSQREVARLFFVPKSSVSMYESKNESKLNHKAIDQLKKIKFPKQIDLDKILSADNKEELQEYKDRVKDKLERNAGMAKENLEKEKKRLETLRAEIEASKKLIWAINQQFQNPEIHPMHRMDLETWAFRLQKKLAQKLLPSETEILNRMVELEFDLNRKFVEV